MTVVDSRDAEPGQTRGPGGADRDSAEPTGTKSATLVAPDVDAPSAPADPTMAGVGSGVESAVADLGAGRGPSWLDSWLRENSPRVVAWRRHIHANPELSRAEYETTAFLREKLTSAGLRPRVLPVNGHLPALSSVLASIVLLRCFLDFLEVFQQPLYATYSIR